MKYFCYDSALNEEFTLVQLMQRYTRHANVFEGTNDAGIWDAAPWLFELNSNPYELKGQPMIQLEHCVVFETKERIKEILDYLQSKIYFKKDAQSKYLRIWDARVLLKYLQNADAKDVFDFYQVFTTFYTESEEDAFLNKWEWKGGNRIQSVKVLKSEALPVIKTEEELNREYEEQHNPKAVEIKKEPPAEIKEPEAEVPLEEKPKRRRFLAD